MGLWLFIGLLIGAVVTFLLMQQQVSQQAKILKRTRMRLEQMEHEQQHRIRDATLQLQEDCSRRLAEQTGTYERQLTEQKARLQAEFNRRAAALNQEYAAHIQPQEPTLEASKQGVSEAGEDASSTLSTLLAPPEADAHATALAPLQPSTVSKSVPPIPSLYITLDSAQKPLSPGFGAKSLTQNLSFTPQGEVPLTPLTVASQQANPADRKQVATALGQFVTGNKRATAQRSIPILGKLIQDPEPSVRQAAAEALGRMSSAKVIPLLKRALRDTDNDVVQMASIALSKFKGASSKTSQSKTRKKLPKNR